MVGEEPVLKPGGSYEYTSGVPLPTPSGFMVGQLRHGDGEPASDSTSTVPAFSLDSPEAKRTVN